MTEAAAPPGGLVLTADDFGIAPEVNEAVELACRRGPLRAASLMVAGPAAGAAIALARRLPGLRVGLHLALLEDLPLLPAAEIPALVDRHGRLRRDMVRLALELVLRPAVRRQLRREIAAQFQAFRRTGLQLDHVNAHRHYHLNPVVAAAVLEIGAEHGMRALRVPLEPPAVLAAAEPGFRPAAAPEGVWAAWLRRRARRAGLAVPDAVFGLRWSGALTAGRLAGLLRHLPPGLCEIYLHPATADGFPGQGPGYRGTAELQALLDPRLQAALARAGRPVGGYADFLSA